MDINIRGHINNKGYIIYVSKNIFVTYCFLVYVLFFFLTENGTVAYTSVTPSVKNLIIIIQEILSVNFSVYSEGTRYNTLYSFESFPPPAPKKFTFPWHL